MMLALSFALHAAAALALIGLPRGTVPERPVEQVALVWSEQAPGAGDAADSAALSEATVPVEPAAAPTAPPAADPPAAEPPAAEPVAIEPVAIEPVAPEQPAAQADLVPPAEPVAQDVPPLPPPPAPPAPSRSAAPSPSPPASSRPAQTARLAASAAAAATPMAQGGGEALGAVVPARLHPGVLNASPAYPPASRMRNEQGRVTLEVEIDPAGRVADLRVVRSSGFQALDQAATEAVRSWRFEAAQRDGRPVLSTTQLSITFQLEGDRRW